MISDRLWSLKHSRPALSVCTRKKRHLGILVLWQPPKEVLGQLLGRGLAVGPYAARRLSGTEVLEPAKHTCATKLQF